MQSYVGKELELFEKAENWKNYYASFLRPFLNGRVLEVGAGIGGTTRHLCDGSQDEWIALEPDPQLAKQIEILIGNNKVPACCKLKIGTLSDFKEGDLFDVIMYIDVIEHISDDAVELINAARHLKKGGYLIILVPAHQWLFSPFDSAIGHFRRYSKNVLSSIIPLELKKEKLIYLDSVGLAASTVNKVFLRQDYPTLRQIKFWNGIMVKISKITDKITFHRLGKSVLGIWKK